MSRWFRCCVAVVLLVFAGAALAHKLAPSLLAIHGTADTVVPYNGKRPGREGSVPRFAARWARRVGCDAHPAVTSTRPRVTRITYRGCDDGLHVGIVRLTGNTHGWAGAGRSPFPQRNPSKFDATAAVVTFALAARRPS